MTAEDHYFQGLEALAAGQIEAAISAYQKAVELSPQYTDALHGLAQAYAQAERLAEAIATAQRITEIDPDDALAHTSLSIFYQKQGKRAEAEEEASKARILGWKQQLKLQEQKDKGTDKQES